MLRKIGRRLTYANLLAVTTAVAVAGCGGGGDTADKASTSPASTTSRDAQAACERGLEKLRREHPGAYVGACNSGTGTLTVP